MKKSLISLAILIIGGFSLSSCVKEYKAPEPGYNVIETGVNSTQLAEAPMDVYFQADRAIRCQRDSIKANNINQSSYSFNIGYITYTIAPADTTTYPKTITVDFGSDTTKAYTGKMTIKMSGNMRNNGSKCALSYQNLITGKSNIVGTDTIFSSGVVGGYLSSRYNMHGGQLIGYGNKMISYSGRIIAKYNVSTGVNVMDSVEINATDANSVVYKLYSVPSYKTQISPNCNYINDGVIKADIKLNNILTGLMIFDYSYNSSGLAGDCDSNGAIYAYSYLNKNYGAQYLFIAKKFY
ncbi:MAG: hypothetical protein Q8908_04620 [Bacteroidota bacterium]|nr:hypothetical protein [Bacteroidota bacterium]